MVAEPALGELLRRYDQALPRYTSYPTAPRFDESYGEEQVRKFAHRSGRISPARRLSLYLHIPYCSSPCFYCGCNRIISRNPRLGELYVEQLLLEAALVCPLFDRGREVIQLHLGGGTPNFLSAATLSRLFAGIDSRFSLSGAAERDFSIELDPRFVKRGDVAQLAALGFNRVSLGVQDFDPAVQQAVNRVQGVGQTVEVIEECRSHRLRSVNIDLIYGLPRQSLAGFESTLRVVIAARPDRVAVYGYAHMPELFKAQRQIHQDELPDPLTKLALLQLAIQLLTSAGYRYIGMDHFALPSDELAAAADEGTLHRNFMGYTIHGDCDLIGMGVSAISNVGDSFSQNARGLPAWEAALRKGQLPVWRGLALEADDVIRRDVIQRIMCKAQVDIGAVENRYGIVFADYFAEALARLEPIAGDGLVVIGRDAIRITPLGRLFLRNIASCFDRFATAAPPPGVRDAAGRPVARIPAFAGDRPAQPQRPG